MKSHTNTLLFLGSIVVSLFLFCCQPNAVVTPESFGKISHPEDNPSSPEKIALGRKLFFDTRLSKDNSISCASCHKPEWAFTDRKRVSEGVGGRLTQRNAPSILNAGYLKTVMFDAHLPTLEMQVIVPIQEHVEMDMDMRSLLQRLQSIPEYESAARKIYGREFDAWVLTRSISAFERSLISNNSRFDQFYYQGNKSALNKSEMNGWKIFSDRLYCTTCHPAPYFTTYVAENNGLYEDYGEDKGRFRIHNDSLDIGKFKVPSLRNIELTYPYMHDGSLKTLDEVISHYESGGKRHVNQHPVIKKITLTPGEKKDLINFLSALTDTSYLKTNSFSLVRQ